MDSEKPPRRVRYNGTHPKQFKDKYKELQPDQYADTVEKIKQKGGTPAGMHIPIMVDEILSFLQIKQGGVGLDATLGYGGHTQALLEALGPEGHLVALDIDPIESAKTEKRLADLGFGPKRLTIHNLNFAQVDQAKPQKGGFDFAMADLGVSSMQIDNPARGFSFKHEGPLDLRLNPLSGITAAQRLAGIGKDELQGLLLENADEPYSEAIAAAVISALKSGRPIETTTHLQKIVVEALGFLPKETQKKLIKKSCQRTFQALRIDVNGEFDVLYSFLEKLPLVLNEGGRVAILTFHSGEDRLVKKSFQQLYRAGVYREISPDVIRPTFEECNRNSRARSTKMRWAIKA